MYRSCFISVRILGAFIKFKGLSSTLQSTDLNADPSRADCCFRAVSRLLY